VQEDPDAPLTGNTAPDSGAAWSPDGSKIAFERTSEIWVMSTLSDDNAVRLTNNRGIDEYPDWQPVPTCTRTGTTGNDKITGTAGKDVLCGLGGNDILLGGDSLQGSAQNDILNGGTGADTASYAGATVGSDLLSYVERLTGTAGADTLTVTARPTRPTYSRGQQVTTRWTPRRARATTRWTAAQGPMFARRTRETKS
jgi:Ca2+-binding RTX toxin-like protein